MITRVFVLCCFISSVASASPSSEAREHFEQGTKAYNLGNFVRAVDEYKKAYELKSDPALLYNIAQAYRLGGDAQQALFFYQSYLHNVPDAQNRAEVEERIKKLEVEMRAQRAVEPPPPAVQVTSTAPAAKTPLYKKWWLWTAVGVAAVGIGLGVGLGVGLSGGGAPGSHFGTQTVQ